MANIKTDVVVIGSGPGGEGAAMQLAKYWKKVTLVEKYSRIGGVERIQPVVLNFVA